MRLQLVFIAIVILLLHRLRRLIGGALGNLRNLLGREHHQVLVGYHLPEQTALDGLVEEGMAKVAQLHTPAGLGPERQGEFPALRQVGHESRGQPVQRVGQQGLGSGRAGKRF